MRHWCFYLTFCAVFSVIIAEQGYDRKDIVGISSGTSFGECLGYCRRSIFLRANSKKLIALKEPNAPDSAYPPKEKQYRISSKLWKELIQLVDLKQFRALDDRIGCPDCADGGAEWIEIKWNSSKKRVTFENGRSIQGFDALVKKLRALRKEYVSY